MLLAACGDSQPVKGERGDQGPAGPPGPPGTPGAAGSPSVIRMTENECRGPCALTCEANEKILNAYVLGGASGRFVFEEVSRVTFRPQGTATTPIRVVVACIPK
jgi:hypothetical protein